MKSLASLLAVSVLLVCTPSHTCVSAMRPYLEARIQPLLSGSVATTEMVEVRFEIENFSDDDVYVLKYDTPFEEFDGHMVGDPFEVTFVRELLEVDYLGITAKHTEPTREDYIHLPPRSYIGIEVNLAKSYHMNAKGKYHISPKTYLHISASAHSMEDLDLIDVSVVPVTLELESGGEMLVQTLPDKQPYNLTFATTATSPCKSAPVAILPGCKQSDHADIYKAWAQATKDVPHLKVWESENPHDKNSARWFGLEGDRLSAVKQAYHNVYSLLCQDLNGSGARAKCEYSCPYFAYVHPSDSAFTIHLCKAWFRAGPIGRDSKFGTVVHESAHFYKVYGTGDYGYGCRNAQSLAKYNTARARRNSDNIEYTVEFNGFDNSVPSC